MEIRFYFQMLKRGWWIILLTSLVALVVALAASYIVTPRYEAVSRFIISPRVRPGSPDQGLWGLDILGGNQTITSTYMEVMKSDRIYQDAARAMELPPENWDDYISEVQILENSTVIELKVSGPNSEMTARLANSMGNQAIQFTARLNEYYRMDFLDEAIPPESPVSPKPLRDSILAFGIGLLLGGVLAIVRDYLMVSLESYRIRFQLDNATGVYNRRRIAKILEDELTDNPDGLLSVGIIELGGLRDLEDTLPSAEYQNILRQATAILQKELRGHDIIGRWDDNSFLIILPNTPGSAANRIFKRIYSSLANPVDLRHLDLSIDLNPLIGGGEYSSNIESEELLEKATEALGNARKDKSNSIYIWELKNPFWNIEE
jgi:diguanylate cyclase (GGDEF)-like protein